MKKHSRGGWVRVRVLIRLTVQPCGKLCRERVTYSGLLERSEDSCALLSLLVTKTSCVYFFGIHSIRGLLQQDIRPTPTRFHRFPPLLSRHSLFRTTTTSHITRRRRRGLLQGRLKPCDLAALRTNHALHLAVRLLRRLESIYRLELGCARSNERLCFLRALRFRRRLRRLDRLGVLIERALRPRE